MNQTFKVVFNKARGALMVVNEVTSCVQAKGTKTVIAATLTAVAGAAFAADFPVAVHDMNKVVFEGPVEETFENDSGLKAFVLPGDDGKASITDSTVKKRHAHVAGNRRQPERRDFDFSRVGRKEKLGDSERFDL